MTRGGGARATIDVEGHEASVLRGAERTLRELRPAVLVEIEARHQACGAGADGPEGASPVEAIAAWMLTLGYRGYFFPPGGVRPVREFDAETHQRYGSGVYCNDFLFVGPAPAGATEEEWARRLGAAGLA